MGDGDRYLLIKDFPSYIDAQDRVDATYANTQKWCKLSIEAASSMAKFSTDRTMREYSDVIWGIKPSPRPVPVAPRSPDKKASPVSPKSRGSPKGSWYPS